MEAMICLRPKQSNFREAFFSNRGCGGNDARVFALRQDNTLKPNTRARLEFFNQCHATLKLSQVCMTE